VYRFVCDAHESQNMVGTITVKAADGSVPTPTPQATVQPSPTPAAPVRDGTPAPTPKAWAALEGVVAKSAKLSVLLEGKLKLTARCASVNKGTVTLTVSRAVAKRLKLKGTTLASGSSRCNGNNRFSAALRPTAAARRALKRYRKAVAVVATLRFGGVRVSRKLMLAGRS
jgi:hypothetical protein